MARAGRRQSRQFLRMTAQRQAILAELRRLTTHPTADELHSRVRRRLPRISLATVYRNLDVLCRAGLIAPVSGDGAPRRFDSNVEPHYHVRCVRCDRVEDMRISPSLARQLQRSTAAPAGFRITEHRLEFLGLCRRCCKSRRAVSKKPGR